MENVATDRQGSVAISITGSSICVTAAEPIATIAVLGIDGKVIDNLQVNSSQATFTTGMGIKLISVHLESGITHNDKVVIR